MKSRFKKGLLIYTLVMLAVIFIGLFVFWQYIKAYEYSRPDYVVDAYMEQELRDVLEQDGQVRAQQLCTPEEVDNELATIRELLNNGNFDYRKVTEEYSEDAPVYSIRMNQQEVGRVWLEPRSGRHHFGFLHWAFASSEIEIYRLATQYDIYVPADVTVTVGGEALTSGSWMPKVSQFPPALEQFADSLGADMPDYLRYGVTRFTVPTVDAGPDYDVTLTDDNVFLVTPRYPEELETELSDYAADFVTAYIAFTSNATGPGLASTYVLPGGKLYQRINGAGDAMRWVHGITYTMSDLTVDSFQYYGTAATLEAHYILTPYGGGETVGNKENHSNMHIVLTQTSNGWRVADIELYEG